MMHWTLHVLLLTLFVQGGLNRKWRNNPTSVKFDFEGASMPNRFGDGRLSRNFEASGNENFDSDTEDTGLSKFNGRMDGSGDQDDDDDEGSGQLLTDDEDYFKRRKVSPAAGSTTTTTAATSTTTTTTTTPTTTTTITTTTTTTTTTTISTTTARTTTTFRFEDSGSGSGFGEDDEDYYDYDSEMTIPKTTRTSTTAIPKTARTSTTSTSTNRNNNNEDITLEQASTSRPATNNTTQSPFNPTKDQVNTFLLSNHILLLALYVSLICLLVLAILFGFCMLHRCRNYEVMEEVSEASSDLSVQKKKAQEGFKRASIDRDSGMFRSSMQRNQKKNYVPQDNPNWL